MNLLLDIGNSTISRAMETEGNITSPKQFSYSADSLAMQLDEHLSQLEKPDAVAVASVAADATNRAVQDWFAKHWHLDSWHATVSESYQELRNSYSDVQQMGIDRWLAMIAAWSEYRTALCVIDSGTALTIDLVDSTGQHAGGYILPGIRLMQQSLIQHTDRINTDILNRVDILPAANTQQAINNGACLATIAAVERALEDFNEHSSCKARCIITGGYAEQLSAFINQRIEHRPDLVLRGLALVYEASR